MIWDCIIFSQEFKKVEYEEKNIYSMIFIDKIEIMNELEEFVYYKL